MTLQEELFKIADDIKLVMDCLKIRGRADRSSNLTRLYRLQEREAEIIQEMKGEMT